ncbi:serine hydrolase domain-containing protein [Mycobacterium palustre]|uniref:Beta-lactamase-related domain-containing protein n=1 Tax=Mycobacterium palustre TaxID=153971 RepID=A0A1X1ZN51_9MYCO|nr:serine hydrolase domain-containing protein [Mycobacterium palustre]MCV7103930.1 beta-lactamase family protein [Mycobacterium palustre]ORW24829.1 hypothetical protein AWC19_08555 [Mycobacterium palustre]
MLWDSMIRASLVAVAVLVVGACGGGHPAAPGAASSGTTGQADVKARDSQKVLDDNVKAHAPGCSAAVGVDGNVAWTGVRGVADMSASTAITPRTVFDIASVSKQFTATALLLLVDEGKLALDDPISRYLPELPAWGAGVDVGQLMHQTSGIPEYVGLLEAQGFQIGDRTSQEQALRALAAVPKLEFQPGSAFEYSNSNYLLLGEVVRRVAGEPLPRFLAERVFRPLGLAMVLDPTGPIPDKAVAYEKVTGGYRPTESLWEQVGDGGIQTTPRELVAWADNYRTGRVGGSRLRDAQLAGAVPTEPGGADRYGAGIYLLADGKLDHDGAWAGFVTAFRVSRDRHTALAVTCNTDKQDPESLADALAKLWM